MNQYQGLQQYLQPREQAPDTRSAEAQRRAASVSAWGIAAQRMAEEVTEEAWAAHRRVQDSQVGTDRGLFGTASPQARGAALGAPGMAHSGDQVVTANGHLAWEANRDQPGVRRLYAADIQERQDPVLRCTIPGSSGDGLF